MQNSVTRNKIPFGLNNPVPVQAQQPAKPFLVPETMGNLAGHEMAENTQPGMMPPAGSSTAGNSGTSASSTSVNNRITDDVPERAGCETPSVVRMAYIPGWGSWPIQE